VKNNLKNIFKFLDKNRIDYLLLRPIDFSKELTDIDLIINKLVFLRLLQLLEKSNFSVKCKYTNYRESIKLFVDHITLDIQHFVAFLPYKGLVIKENTLSAGIKIENNSMIYPAVKDEILFTFWLYRLLLCKGEIINETIPIVFKEKFSTNWENSLNSLFFKEWTGYICGEEKYNNILNLLTTFFENNMKSKTLNYNSLFTKFVFENHRGLKFNYAIQKLKFKTLRRLGLYNKFIGINYILKSY
jgi:hypothetical protein